MPMMKLAATSIDQIPRDRERVIHTLLKYFHTDSLCLRAEDTDPVAGIIASTLFMYVAKLKSKWEENCDDFNHKF